MKILLSLSALLLSFNFTVFASDIKGRLIDAGTREPIEFVTTVLLKSDSTYITGCQSDTMGVFVISGRFEKQDYLLKTSFMGYKTMYIKISNLAANIDLGDIELHEESQFLGEVTVTANRIINKVDRQIILPDSMQIKSSVNAFDLLSNMSLARLNIDPVNQTIKIGNEDVQLRINGVRATIQEVAALRSKDILRVEYFEDPGVRFGNENVGAVINLIVDRQKNYGGYVSIDARNSPYVGFGDDNVTFKINNKASEFGLNYYINYRSYDKRWSDASEQLNFTNNSIHREQKGVEAPMQYQYHRFNFSYNLTSVDKYVFNAVFKNELYNYENTSLFNNFYSDRVNQTFSKSHNDGLEYTPAIDLYYKRELKNKQSIAANVVGTYITSNSKRSYLETENSAAISDIFNKVDGNKYSIIGEVVYEKQFVDMAFSAGAKHTQGFADNKYSGNTDTKTDMKNSDSYIFSQIQGKIAKKLGYTFGLGGARIWFNEGEKDATFYTFRPSVQLSYQMNDNLSLKYSFIVNNRIPSLGQLSNVEQQVDAYQISRGNPNLRPTNIYNNRLTINLNKGIFEVSSAFGYKYFEKPFVNTYSIENDKIISYLDNHKGQGYLSWNGDVTAKLIKDIWTLSGWLYLQRCIFDSKTGATHTYNVIFGGFRSNMMYKNYSLVLGFNSRYKELWGESIYYGEDWNYIEAGYKHKEAKLTLGMSYPFKDYWSSGNKNISSIKPSQSWWYIKENGHMLYLRFSWNMSFGRKHEAGKKSLDNADTDKGTL